MKPKTLAIILTWGVTIGAGVVGRFALCPLIRVAAFSSRVRLQLASWFPSLADSIQGEVYEKVIEGAIAPWGGIVLGIAIIAIPVSKIIWSSLKDFESTSVKVPTTAHSASFERPALGDTVSEGVRDAFLQLATRWEQHCTLDFLDSHPEAPRNEVLGTVRAAIWTLSEEMVPSLTADISKNIEAYASGQDLPASELKEAIRERIVELVTEEQDVLLDTVKAATQLAWSKRKGVAGHDS